MLSSSASASTTSDRGKKITWSYPLATETDEKTPLIFRQFSDVATVHNVSIDSAFIVLLKAIIGVGLMSIPYSFRYTGLWFGFGLIFGLGAVNGLVTRRMAKAASEFCQRKRIHDMDYGSLMKNLVAHGPHVFRKYSYLAMCLANATVFAFVFGTGSFYIAFIHVNMIKYIENSSGESVDRLLLMCLIVTAVSLLCSVRQLRNLASVMLLGNILYVVALMAMLVQIATLPPVDNAVAASQVSVRCCDGLAVFLSTLMQSVGSAYVVIPILNQLEYGSQEFYYSWNGPVAMSSVLAAVLYSVLGFYGYYKLGETAQSAISLNLPSEYWYERLVNLLFSLSVLISYPLQMYPLMNSLDKFVSNNWFISEDRLQRLVAFFGKIAIVLLTASVALLVPDVGLLVGLNGAATGSLVLLVVPALIVLLNSYDEHGGHCAIFDTLVYTVVLLFGVVLFAVGTFDAMQKILEQWA